MNTKQTLVLAILAVVLVAAAFMFNKREEAVTESAATSTRTVLDGITSGTVEKIEIAAPQKEVVALTKRDAVWYTDVAKKHKADKSHMNALFSAIEKEIEGEVVSTNPENFGEYDVNESSGTRVKLYGSDSKILKDFIVGKAAANFFSTFVREAKANEVINAKASLSYVFNKPEGWRDKTIFELTVPQIVGLDAAGTSGTWTARKVDDKWTAEQPEGREIQENKVQTLASTLATLRANEFIDIGSTESLATFGLDPPRQKLTVTYEDRSTSPPKSETAVLLIGNKKENPEGWYAKRTDADTVYTITEYQATTLAPSLEEILQAPPAPPQTDTPTTATAETTTETATTSADALTTEAATAPADTATTEAAPAASPDVTTSPAAATPAPAETPAPTPAPPAPEPAATPVPPPATETTAQPAAPAPQAPDSATTAATGATTTAL